VAVSPAVTGTTFGRTIQFTSFLGGGSVEPVVWSVDGGSANGSITSSGVYTAPSTAGTYTIRVTSSSNPARFATASINVASAVTVNVVPQSVQVKYGFGASVPMNLSVAGADPNSVTWRVREVGGGSVSPSGVYTAPSTPGAFTIECSLNADPSISGAYSVVVSDTKLIKFETSRGEFLIRMAEGEAPNTTKNFVDLARSGFYDGVYFHRYGPDDRPNPQAKFIQGGDPLTKTLPLSDPSIGTGGPGYQINFETNSLRHVEGAIAMARSVARDSAGSQFYICHEAIPGFDGDYVVFGKVIRGLTIAQSLRRGDQIIRATVID
jgi:peptidyl-prolyl cis-trans isomerase B (cyclophilin B)